MDTTKMFGLVIGVANYQNINALPESVINDACDVYECLVDGTLCGYTAGNVRLLTDYQATKDEFLIALKWLSEVGTKASTVFIYFSGHGGRIPKGDFADEYLLPYDCSCSSDKDLAESSIPGSDFANALKLIQAKKLILILDCCHASGIGHVKNLAGTEMKAGLSESYLEMLKSGRGRVVFASSRESEYSYVLPDERNSVFTTHLLAGLRGGMPSPDGLIRIFDLFHFLQPRVTSAQPKQHPVFKCEIEENFPIALALGGRSIVPGVKRTDDGYKYDVFINYGGGKEWIKRTFIPALEAKGVRTCVDFRDFGLGKPKTLERERCVRESRYTLAVLSREFVDRKLMDFESFMAEQLEEEEGRSRLMGILLDDCSPRLGLSFRTLLGMEDDEEFDECILKLSAHLTAPIGDE